MNARLLSGWPEGPGWEIFGGNFSVAKIWWGSPPLCFGCSLHDRVFSFSASIGLIKICHITRFKGRPCSGKKRIYNCQGMQSVMKKFLDYICGNMVSSKTTMFDIKKNTLSRSSSSPSKKAQKFAILLSFGESLFIPSTGGPDDRKHHACQLLS